VNMLVVEPPDKRPLSGVVPHNSVRPIPGVHELQTSKLISYLPCFEVSFLVIAMFTSVDPLQR